MSIDVAIPMTLPFIIFFSCQFFVMFFITLIQFFNSVTEGNEDIDENDKTMRGMKLNS